MNNIKGKVNVSQSERIVTFKLLECSGWMLWTWCLF